MFNINYNKDGEIVGYQEGQSHDDNETPKDCKTLSFKDPIPGMFSQNGTCLMFVNTKTNKLEFINPVKIPEPIANPANNAK